MKPSWPPWSNGQEPGDIKGMPFYLEQVLSGYYFTTILESKKGIDLNLNFLLPVFKETFICIFRGPSERFFKIFSNGIKLQ